jgi:hypothetical protein
MRDPAAVLGEPEIYDRGVPAEVWGGEVLNARTKGTVEPWDWRAGFSVPLLLEPQAHPEVLSHPTRIASHHLQAAHLS